MNWLKSWLAPLKSARAKRAIIAAQARARRPYQRTPLRLELLENRCLLTGGAADITVSVTTHNTIEIDVLKMGSFPHFNPSDPTAADYVVVDQNLPPPAVNPQHGFASVDSHQFSPTHYDLVDYACNAPAGFTGTDTFTYLVLKQARFSSREWL